MEYLPRVVDSELRALLRIADFVVIEGAKGVGKTATARQAAHSAVALDADPNARSLAAADPEALLSGPTPRLIDEWQRAPSIWNHVRHSVDARQGRGQFILTGSHSHRVRRTCRRCHPTLRSGPHDQVAHASDVAVRERPQQRPGLLVGIV
ncbi:MAG: AAA family ATPase [Mycobacterium sp.]